MSVRFSNTVLYAAEVVDPGFVPRPPRGVPHSLADTDGEREIVHVLGYQNKVQNRVGSRLGRLLRSRYGLVTLIGLLLASLLALIIAVSVIRRERQYTREDAQRLSETIKEKVAEINRHRSLTSEEFGAATRTLRDLALQAQTHPAGEPALPQFKEDVLREAHEGAQRMASYADQAGGTDLAAAHDRIPRRISPFGGRNQRFARGDVLRSRARRITPENTIRNGNKT